MARRAKSVGTGDGVNGEGGNIADLNIDPTAIEPGIGELESDDAGLGDAKPKRKYNRRGDVGGESRSRKTAAQKSLDLSGVSSTLYGIHAMLAVMVKAPELAITETEAATLASAISNVQRHYDLGATQKTMDWVNLATCVAVMYGPRIYAISSRKPPRPAPTPATPGFDTFVNAPPRG